MDSFLVSTDCLATPKDTMSASQLPVIRQQRVATAAQADASSLKCLSRKQQHHALGAPGSTLSPFGTDAGGRQKHDQQVLIAHQMTNKVAEYTSRYDRCTLLTDAAPYAADKVMSAATSSSSCSTPSTASTTSSRPVPPPALTLPELQEQQHSEYSQHHQQYWIPRAMPAQPSPAAAAAGRMLMQPCMAAAAAASLSGTLSPPAKVVGVRAAAALLGSGDCTPECLSPVGNHTATISGHAAALEAALRASRLN